MTLRLVPVTARCQDAVAPADARRIAAYFVGSLRKVVPHPAIPPTELTLRDLPKRPFECLYGLAALNQISVVQNYARHCVNASILIKLLARANLRRVLVGIEYLTGAFAVQSNARCNVLEHLEVAWIEAFSKVGD